MDSVSGVMPDRNESLVMAIVVGSAVVLIALFTAFTCGLLWSRRKGSSRSNRGSMAPSSLGNPSDNYFMLYPSRNPNDSLPEISNVSDPAHAQQTTDLGQAFYGTFPRRVISPKLSHSTLPPQAAQRSRTKTVAPQANKTHTAGETKQFRSECSL